MIPLKLFRDLRVCVPEPAYRRQIMRAGLYGLFIWKGDHWELNSQALTSRLMHILEKNYA